MFRKENIVRMWIAHGYLVTKHSDRMESMGDKHISELVGRSFFQCKHSRGLGCYFTMHDLIHDLARSLVMDQNQGQQLQGLTPNFSNARADIITSKYDRHFSAFVRAKSWETPLIVQSSRSQNQESMRSVLLCLDGGNGEFSELNTVGYLVVL